MQVLIPLIKYFIRDNLKLKNCVIDNVCWIVHRHHELLPFLIHFEQNQQYQLNEQEVIDLGNLIAFINQRKDVQIQPQTDNILAYEFTRILCDQFGSLVSKIISFDNPSPFYQKMARTGRATNLYFPEPEVDRFEWNENDFIYQCRREELNGEYPKEIHRTVFKRLQIKYFNYFYKFGIMLPSWFYPEERFD